MDSQKKAANRLQELARGDVDAGKVDGKQLSVTTDNNRATLTVGTISVSFPLPSPEVIDTVWKTALGAAIMLAGVTVGQRGRGD